MKKRLTRRQLQRIINEELEGLDHQQNEGFFKGAAAAASRYLPGGGVALDYVRSQAFERIEEKLEDLERRIAMLEQRP
tara:strand:+ start:371 stop:604 length:234 start_codon:yes stop_codon:yes gene_type:complete